MFISSKLTVKLVINLILAMILLLILQNYVYFIIKLDLFRIPVFIIEWLLFLVLLNYFFYRIKGYFFLKGFLIIIFLKIIIYTIFFNDYNFAKGILVLILLIIFSFENEYAPELYNEFIKKYYNIIFILILLTVIPFIGWYNRYDSVIAEVGLINSQRFAGLWELPHDLAYYLFALIILQKNIRIVPFILMLLIIIATGVRSVFIALLFYFVYDNLIIKLVTKSYRKIAIFLICIISILVIPTTRGFVISQVNFHLSPLFQQNIEDNNYGKGRVLYAYYDLQKIEEFNFIEFLIGKSATQLYADYKELLGIESWPHDDFLTVPYIYGIIGLLFYIYYLIIYPLRNIPLKNNSKVISIIISIIILAITNGFYTYHAMYLFIFAIVINKHENKNA